MTRILRRAPAGRAPRLIAQGSALTFKFVQISRKLLNSILTALWASGRIGLAEAETAFGAVDDREDRKASILICCATDSIWKRKPERVGHDGCAERQYTLDSLGGRAEDLDPR